MALTSTTRTTAAGGLYLKANKAKPAKTAAVAGKVRSATKITTGFRKLNYRQDSVVEHSTILMQDSSISAENIHVLNR